MCQEDAEALAAFTHEIRQALLREMEHFLTEYRSAAGVQTQWKLPLIGFAGADHPYIRSLKQLISPTHYMPEEILPGARTILSYFVGFQDEIGQGNIPGDAPSLDWTRAYTETNEMFLHMNAHLQKTLASWGYRAASPEHTGTLGPDRIYSNWSQRHIAYAAGLGTFGMNNMLITDNGCGGRFYSLVTDLPVLPGEPLERENCLYKRSGTCGACIRRCPVGALSAQLPFDRARCRKQLRANESAHGERVCGKCTVGMPCTFRAP